MTLNEAFIALGVNAPHDFVAIERLPYDAGLRQLDAMKERVRKSWKQLALQYHPDKTGNNAELAEIWLFLTQVKVRIEKMSLQPAPRPVPQPAPTPPPQKVVFWAPRQGSSDVGTARTVPRVPYGSPGSILHVIWMKP